MARLKVRSHKDGSAVPLDDTDKKLLNLMQGRFPIEPRPYAAVAREVGLSEEAVLSRIQELLDERVAVLETLTSIRRAGADAIVTYYAKEAAGWLR